MDEQYYPFDMEERSRIQTYERNDNLSFNQKFDSYHMIENDTTGAYTKTTGGFLETSPLTDAYFSKRNIAYIQQQIIENVKRLSNGKYVIGPQNASELITIMRSMFLQFQENLYLSHPKEMAKYVKIEIQNLNKRVLDWSVERVMNAIEQYLESMRIKRQGVLPLDRSIDTSITGTKTDSNGLNRYYLGL